MNGDHDDASLVAPGDACPTCGQREIDLLVWTDDERVRCSTCGTVYDPLDRRADRTG